MKRPLPLASLALAACLAACGGSTEASGGSTARVTDPAQLPEDRDGLIDVYESLMTQAVEIVEGIDTEEQLTAGLQEIEKLGPAFAALMERSEQLDVSVDEGAGSDADALADRMSAGMRRLFEKFPTQAMAIQNAFTGALGGAGPR